MPYDELRDELQSLTPPRIVAFPDGSEDTYCRVRGEEGYVSSREEFGTELAEGAESFRLELQAREAGGQAVNMATQVHALGGRVTLIGHLDHPTLSELPYTTRSMGEPASVSVVQFEDDSVMLATDSTAIRDWTVADLQAAIGGDFTELFAADGICCGNVASFPALTDVFRTLASRGGRGGVFVFDPGTLSDVADHVVSDCFDALGELDDEFDVVVSVNRTEMELLAERAGTCYDSDAKKLKGVQRETSVSGVVYHGKERAVAATGDGTVTVENLPVSTVERPTGAGDRFSGGLTFGLAAGWNWKPTLALANVCASWRVEHGTTVDRERVQSQIRNG